MVSTNTEGEGQVKRNLASEAGILHCQASCLAPEKSQALAMHNNLAAVLCAASASGLLKHRSLATVIQHIAAGSASHKATESKQDAIHCF